MLDHMLRQYVFDTENPEKNYSLARAYENLGQTASAISFYLRAAERYYLTNELENAYESLLRLSLCFQRQGNRNHTVKRMMQNALCILPKRPEAYYLLSRMLEINSEHVDAYVYATIALENCDFDVLPLRSKVDYPGKYGLIFEKAVSAWWWGKTMESRNLLRELGEKYYDVMDENHLTAVQKNLMNLGCGPVHIAYKQYDATKHDTLKFKFEGSSKIVKNYSQVYQDMFVLAALNGKRNGTYVEIGGGDPFHGNNTALLEELSWKGFSIEINEELAKKYTEQRKNKMFCEDALKFNYEKAFAEQFPNSDTIDYLQVDCEPSKTTFEILLSLPLEKYKFAVITYEHDHYIDMTKSYREKSRRFLRSMGYELVVNDVSPDGRSTFEDWWVHPDLVGVETINLLKSDISKTTKIDEYFHTTI